MSVTRKGFEELKTKYTLSDGYESVEPLNPIGEECQGSWMCGGCGGTNWYSKTACHQQGCIWNQIQNDERLQMNNEMTHEDVYNYVSLPVHEKTPNNHTPPPPPHAFGS